MRRAKGGSLPPLRNWGGDGGGVRSSRERALLAAAAVGALLVQILLSFHIRLRAWPETLVPAYLVSRGWMLYRDVKFAHMPLWIAIEAVIGGILGFNIVTLRVLSLGLALLAHASVWRAGAALGWKPPARIGASLFFLATFYLWDGNAVYPDVAIAALSLPAFLALRRRGPRGVAAAGLLLGSAVAIKQPAVVGLVAGAVWLAIACRPLLGRFLVFAAIPCALCVLFFGVLGELREFLLWTVVVPLRDYRGRTNLAIGAAQMPLVLLGGLVLLAFLVVARGPAGTPGRSRVLFVLLTLGFAAMAFPKFELVHLVAAVPLLAIAAGAVLDIALRSSSVVRFAAAIPIVIVALDAAYLATDTSSGEISFWDSPANDAVVRRLAALPSAPLYLYGPDQDILIRSRRVPPGRIYANPGLWFQLRADDLESRQVTVLRAHPETVVLSTPGNVETGDAGAVLANWIGVGYRATGWPGGVIRLMPRAPDSGAPRTSPLRP